MKLLTMIRSGEVRAAVWEDKEHHSETGVGMRDGKQRQQAVRKDQARSSEWGSAVRSGRGKLRKLFPQKGRSRGPNTKLYFTVYNLGSHTVFTPP